MLEMLETPETRNEKAMMNLIEIHFAGSTFEVCAWISPWQKEWDIHWKSVRRSRPKQWQRVQMSLGEWHFMFGSYGNEFIMM